MPKKLAQEEPDFQYYSPDGTVIEEKQQFRDLEVELASDLTFAVHIANTVAGASKLVRWAHHYEYWLL